MAVALAMAALTSAGAVDSQKSALRSGSGVNAIKLLYLPQMDLYRASDSLVRQCFPVSPFEGGVPFPFLSKAPILWNQPRHSHADCSDGMERFFDLANASGFSCPHLSQGHVIFYC